MISAPATAGEFDTSITTKLDACIKSVSLIGAQIKHKEVTRADGSPAFEFVVRSTGADYRVMCDAKTGVLGDVSPLTGNASG
jgi:hypothetical protein